MTRLLASDWLTESDVGGPVVGPAWPLSSKVNDFNQFLITDHTPDQDQWDKLGHSGPQHLSPAFPPLCLDAILTWIKKSWCPMCCVDLAGGGHHRNTGLWIGLWSDCFITRPWRGLLELLGAALYNT